MTHYFKHVHSNRISYWAIQDNGIFVNVTVTPRSMTQQLGQFDPEKTVEDRLIWIERMKKVGEDVNEQQFFEVQNYFSQNGAKFFNSEVGYDELRKFINERNIKKKVDDTIIAPFGELGLDW